VNTADEFVDLLRDELGLTVTAADLEVGFDELPGWDSLHLLWLLTLVERRTGRVVSLPEVLEAANLRDLYALVSA
jgi:acyl carrier protein